MSHQQLLMEHESKRLERRTAPSGMKTIVLHILDDEFHDQRIDCALSLARASSAHLSCVHVTPLEACFAYDKLGGFFVVDKVIRAVDERDANLRRKVEERFTREDVSWNYTQITGNVAAALVGEAGLADLLITARDPFHHDFLAPTLGFLGELLHRSRTPLFIPAFPQTSFDPTGVAIIAWDGSFEAANAVRSAVGLLSLAAEVRIIQVRERRADERKSFPATDVLEYLSRHGIHADLKIEDPPGGHPSEDVLCGMIVAEALGTGASYIVMGGYSHTRVAEYLFGGVTRMLLKECPVPLLIAH